MLKKENQNRTPVFPLSGLDFEFVSDFAFPASHLESHLKPTLQAYRGKFRMIPKATLIASSVQPQIGRLNEFQILALLVH